MTGDRAKRTLAAWHLKARMAVVVPISRDCPQPLSDLGDMTLAPELSVHARQTSPAAHAIGLCKTYGKGQAAVKALDGVEVAFERGRFTAVMGPSGSGKSTLLHCMAGLDAPTSGHTYVGEQDIAELDDGGLTELRRDRVGFVFQSFNLVPTLTARENIELPRISPAPRSTGLVRLPGGPSGHRRPAVSPTRASCRAVNSNGCLRPGSYRSPGSDICR